MAHILCRADGGSEPAEDCRSEETAPGPWGFKTNASLISCHEDVHLFKGPVFGSIIQVLQNDIPNA
jgi:hypothetical protein